MTRTPPRARLACALLVAGLVVAAWPAAAGESALRRSTGGTIPPGRPPAALIPLENLAGREEQGALFTKVIFAGLVASGALEMTDPGRVDEVMDSLGIRAGGSLTPAETRILGDTLHVQYLLLGSVLESGRIMSAGEDLPAVGATLRLVRVEDGRVMWAGVHFRSGEDHETLFGWGRVTSTEKLVRELVLDLLGDFREAGARNLRAAGKEASR